MQTGLFDFLTLSLANQRPRKTISSVSGLGLSVISFFRGFALPFAFHSCTEITRKGKKDSMYSVLSLEFLRDARISRLVVLISPLNCSGN